MRSHEIAAPTTGLLVSAAELLAAQVQPPTCVRVVKGFVICRSLVVSTDKPARIVGLLSERVPCKIKSS